VYQTALFSLAMQVSLGLFTAVGLFFGNSDGIEAVFALELASQVVEFCWYVAIICKYRDFPTWSRYLDWVVTTPVMLISTALFFGHRAGEDIEGGILYIMLSFNWVMLSFGFAVEVGAVQKVAGLVFGSAAFVISFIGLASYVDWGDVVSAALFWVMACVWSLYGVAASFPYEPKNIAYNLLDIVAKNFYGVFLTCYSLIL
jgi:bacteriorhodopsin